MIPWFQAQALSIPLPFGLPNLTIHPFGMLVLIGVIFGVLVLRAKARRDGLSAAVIGELAGYQLFAGFVLGHVLDAIFYHWDVVVVRPMLILELWNGLSSFGGFIGAAVGSAIWCKRRGHSFLAFADPIAFSFPFGWLFGRLGCFTVHDHPGQVTDFVLGVADYQVGTPPYQVRHDLGLYEVFWCLGMIPLFLFLGRTRRRRGIYLAILPLCYAPIRFGLDFLRATDVSHGDPRLYLGLTPGHFGAVLLLAAGLGVLLVLRATKEPRIAADARDVGDSRGARRVLAALPEGQSSLVPTGTSKHAKRYLGGVVELTVPARAAASELVEELAGLGAAAHVLLFLDKKLPEEDAAARVDELRGALRAADDPDIVLFVDERRFSDATLEALAALGEAAHLEVLAAGEPPCFAVATDDDDEPLLYIPELPLGDASDDEPIDDAEASSEGDG